jgi:hypothetical protein
MKATFIKVLDGYTGIARLFKCDPPINGASWNGTPKFDFVVVSAAVTPDHGPETYIFGADKDGEILDWSELDGSFVGGLDHERALKGAGYEVEYPA